MLELGGLVFSSPWLLTALVGLPALWWLLRVTPPSPRLVNFPPIRLLLALRPNEETPARTPWWLILLRILLAALVILALAHPLLNPGARLLGSGPLVIVIDDGWASAADWPARERKLNELLEQAARENRSVHLLTTAVRTPGEPIVASRLMRASEARELAAGLEPQPWPNDRAAALRAVEDLDVEGSAHTVWLSDGLDSENARALAERLQSLGSLEIVEQPRAARAGLVHVPQAEGDVLRVPVFRVAAPDARNVWVRAVTEDGRLVGRVETSFGEGAGRAEALLTLPGEVRNDVARIEIEGSTNAGAVFLMDERWRRRPVGIVSGDFAEEEQPLLSSLYYLRRALGPFAELREGAIDELFERELAVLILADIGRLVESDARLLDEWMAKGGVTLRFAGPKLASGHDELIPVRLRDGGRALGGAMSWSEPARLLPFEESSPFAGIEVPRDVRVSRQVLAEPALDLNSKTWARLADGTPLITAEKRGRGWLILVHTTANTDWSNLPISGLFVEMLRRIVGLSAGIVAGTDENTLLPPLETLDGFGQLGSPSSDAITIAARQFDEARPGPATPPGYYGRDTARRALNLATAVESLQPLGEMPAGIERTGFASEPSVDFKPWLLLAALLLALADLLISFFLRGMIRVGTVGRATAGVLVAAVLIGPLIGSGPAEAQPSGIQEPSAERTIPPGPDSRALEATLSTRLAFVVTGDDQLDEMTRAGLRGLSDVLRRRTAVEPDSPLAVDVETDELAFYPLLYWAVSPRQPLLSENARRKLNQYLRTGGTILFDTRERSSFESDSTGGVGSAGMHLRRLLQGLDVPALTHVPPDHVLTKAFYLLNDFPGRWTGGPVWVEQRGGRHNDGVSSVVIGSNDWAAAWAIDGLGRPLAAVVPGGENQREMAYRFGVNWIMYALTGNYKTDQVHVPAIIERLGQ